MAVNRPSEGAKMALSTISPAFKQPESNPPLLPRSLRPLPSDLSLDLLSDSLSPNASSRLLRVSAPGPKSFESCLHQKRAPCRRGRSRSLSGNRPRIRLFPSVRSLHAVSHDTHGKCQTPTPGLCPLLRLPDTRLPALGGRVAGAFAGPVLCWGAGGRAVWAPGMGLHAAGPLSAGRGWQQRARPSGSAAQLCSQR